jgi:transcriptional regulator with XRE-family HTH domain
MHLSSGLAKGEKNISLDMPGLILKLKDRRGWSYQELAAQLGVSAATVEKYIARVPQYLAVKLADTAGKYGERDLELKFRAYAEGQTTEQEQEKKVPFDFEALSPDAKKIAQIAAEIYTDPTPGEPFEEHFG